jgi:nucleoside-diphosphate-sugar epimerase
MGRVLVTGAKGFLGQAVVAQILAQNIPVRTTDLPGDSAQNLPDFHDLDLLQSGSLAELLGGVSCVIHLAGWAHRFHKERAEKQVFFRVNAGATENLLRAAIAAGAEHFVFISSVAVYGPSPGTVRVETDACRPQGPYAESKYEAERRVSELASQAGIRATILRPATLFGEGDPGNVARLMATIDRRRFVWIGAGANRKSLIYRDDAARGIVLASQRATGEAVEVYNLTGLSPTMREIVEEIAAALGKRTPARHVPAGLALGLSSLFSRFRRGAGRLGALKSTLEKWLADDLYDGDKLRKAVGFQARISLAEGIRRETAWYRAEQGKIARGHLVSAAKNRSPEC